ncbi:MAG TPA: hypothetical protein DEV85_03800 [Vibrio sp.]|nr:hypothetical protein [Vibrio sp.]
MLKPDGSVIEHETYFSNNYNFTHSAESRQHYLKEVIRFAENHYYQPLMDYVDTILTFDRNKNEYVFSSKKLENLVVQLLTIGVNNNYLPATEQLIRLTKADIKPDSDLLKVNLSLGGKEAIVSQYALFNEQLSSSDRYYLGELYKKLSGSYFLSKVEPPTDLNEKAVLDNKVDQIIKNMTPMVYIDGFTSRDKWVD